MHRRPRISSAGVLLAGTGGILAALAATALAASGSPKVTIRIEGRTHTLLATRTVQVPRTGSITKGGAKKGACPADSAAGVLNKATKGRWSGTWSSTYDDYLITKILGDTESGKKSYWEILVDHAQAPTGACELKLHAGDQLVFAAVPVSGKGAELATRAPAHVAAGHAFDVRVVAYSAKGSPKPLAGATVIGAGTRTTTNAKGIAKVTAAHAGKVTLRASKAGDVRAAPVAVKVT